MTHPWMTHPICPYCDEPVLPGEAHPDLINMQDYHRECATRMVIGSAAHIEQVCSCYVPGSDEGDPPGLSKRAAAKLALRALQWREMRRRWPMGTQT